MLDAAHSFFPDIQLNNVSPETVWTGLRPCSMDGLPYIGRLKRLNNIILASGHSMMGVALAPATGKLVSEIVGEKKSSLDLKPFLPERK